MGTWLKEMCVIQIVASTTMSDVASAQTVQFQPVDQAFSAGAITGVQGTVDTSRYYPASDLDSTMCYGIHLNSAATAVFTICGPDTIRLPAE